MYDSDYVITCCSPADLSMEHFEKRHIPVAYFHFTLDDEEYLDDMGKSVSPEEMFRRMNAGAQTKTSQVSVGEYTAFFEPFLKEGKDILHVCLSSGISGTYNSAMMTAKDLREKYPEREIYIVDSLAASSGYGLFVDELADLRDKKIPLKDVYKWAEDNKLKLNHWFFSTDLTYLIRGGRVSRAAGIMGQLLNICPLLNVNREGRLIPREKIRSKKKVIKRTLEMMEMHAAGGAEYSGRCYISQSDCIGDAMELVQMIEKAFPKLKGKVRVYPIGATIGSHTGPGTIALFFWGDERGE